MKTTQTELQKIADAITGTESESEAKTTQVLLAEIRDGIAGTEPNTEIKSTQVLLGEIAQAISDNPPSPAPGETFEVEMTVDLGEGSGDPTITANKTYSQVMAAHASGKRIVINYNITASSEVAVINESWNLGTFIDELGEYSDGSSCLVSGFGIDITPVQLPDYRLKETKLVTWYDPAKIGTIYRDEFRAVDLNYDRVF